MGKKRIIIKEDDPNRNFKLEILELIEKEIIYVMNKILVKVLVWIVVLIIPLISGWAILDYNRGQMIQAIENNWIENDSIIKAVGRSNLKTTFNLQRLDQNCQDIIQLKENKVDKEILKEWTTRFQKQLDRSRQFESEILKRQDLMLQHLLDIKRNI